MTIVLDTSALVSVVLGESDAESYAELLRQHSGDVAIGAATRVEAGIVVEGRQGSAAAADLDRLLTSVRAQTVSIDAHIADLALAGWRRFGKGRHPAGLNLGDCFSYAVAKSLNAPLLYKGRDFDQTDIASAL